MKEGTTLFITEAQKSVWLSMIQEVCFVIGITVFLYAAGMVLVVWFGIFVYYLVHS